jgi:hypothetical protein
MTIAPERLTTAAVFVTGSKGGSGKSTFSNLLTDYYRTLDISTAAYDGDKDNETLAQHYGQRTTDGELAAVQDPLLGVETFNIREPNERDIMLTVLNREARRIIIDLPGGGVEDVADVLPDTDMFFGAFVDAGIMPIVCIAISNVKPSAASVAAIIEKFGSRPRYVVIKNGHFGNEFPAFDGTMFEGRQRFGRPRRLLEEHGGQIVVMPKIQAETYGRWDIASCGLAEAETHGYMQQPADGLRIRAWRKQFANALAGTVLEAK